MPNDISSKAFQDTDDTLKGATGGDEYLREAGNDDEKIASDYIKQYEKEHFELAKQRAADTKESIADKAKFADSYERALEDYANDELEKLDWLPGWRSRAFYVKGSPVMFEDIQIDSIPGKAGLLVCIKREDGEFFKNAFEISKDIDIDYQAVRTLVSQAENVIDDFKKLLYLTNPRKKGETINPISKPVKKKNGHSKV